MTHYIGLSYYECKRIHYTKYFYKSLKVLFFGYTSCTFVLLLIFNINMAQGQENIPIAEFMDIAENIPELNFSIMRERLFTSMLNKLSSLYLTNVSKKNRKFIEFSILYLFISGCLFLGYLHYILHNIPGPCLKEIGNEWPKDGILRIEVIKNLKHVLKMEKLFIYNRTTEVTYFELKNVFLNGPSALPPQLRYNEIDDVNEVSQNNDYWFQNLRDFIFKVLVGIEEPYYNSVNDLLTHYNTKPDERFFHGGPDNDEIYYHTFDPDFIPYMRDNFISIVEFSYYHGLLRLHPTIRHKYNIPVYTLRLDSQNSSCFEHIDKTQIMVNFIGYEESLIVSLKHMAGTETERGYFRDILSGEYFRFVYFNHPKRNILIAVGSMILFTLLISLLLRYSHQQIFVFIMSLLRMFELNIAINSPVAPLITVILALVGMEAIMSEVFHNTSTAFYVIMIVWAGDQFDAIVCRHTLSKKYWLRYFFLTHCTFYVYQYGSNGYFPNLALFISTVFILYTMIKIYHDLELSCFIMENLLDESMDRNIQNQNTTSKGMYYFGKDKQNKWYIGHLKINSSMLKFYEEGQINIEKAYKGDFHILPNTCFPEKKDLALCVIIPEEIVVEYFNNQIEPGFFNYNFPFVNFSNLTNSRNLDEVSIEHRFEASVSQSNILYNNIKEKNVSDSEICHFVPYFYYDNVEENMSTLASNDEKFNLTYINSRNEEFLHCDNDDEENDDIRDMLKKCDSLHFFKDIRGTLIENESSTSDDRRVSVSNSLLRLPNLVAIQHFKNIISNAIQRDNV
ncbi:Membralin [Strongyloides ratti]|uniref:Membralin n=1 Tax=Strongyloides ratti TaxID=34506 RepID=A0A090KXZ6_STRRB|nr:Membralin [Strongyloides ratti]CEF60103.1 Membralin [Strongyloides ratti]